MQDITTNIRQILDVGVDGVRLPGYAAGVLINDSETVFYSGKSSLANNTDINNKTKFHIASLTKYYTALIFRAVENQGLLNEDDLLSKYFPSSGLQAEKIRLKHLLNHTSGIRDQWELTEYAGWKPHELITTLDIVRLFNQQKELNSSPGEHYIYCNTGYTLLALVLEQVTGVSIRTLLKKYVTDEVKISNTGYYAFNEDIKNLAVPYTKDDSSILGYKVDGPNFDVVGSTSMFSTIEDLLQIERNYYSEGFCYQLTQKSDSYITPDSGSEGMYFNGMIHHNFSGVGVQMHAGWDYGYSAFLFRIPERRLSIIILTNYGIPNLLGHAVKIASLLESRLSNDIRISALLNNPNSTGSPTLQDGNFVNQKSGVSFKIENNQGSINLANLKLSPLLNGSFIARGSFNTIKIIDNRQFSWNTLGSSLNFSFQEKTTGRLPSHYTGKFFSEELNVMYEIDFDNGQFLLLGPSATYRLSIITDHVFYSEKFTLTFDTNSEIVEGFRISNLRMWNLKFLRMQ